MRKSINVLGTWKISDVIVNAVMSAKVTGEGVCGPAGGGFFGNSPTLYERLVRGVEDPYLLDAKVLGRDGGTTTKSNVDPLFLSGT